MRNKWTFLISILLVFCLAFTACSGEEQEGADKEGAAEQEENPPKDDYEDYVRSEIASVNGTNQPTATPTATPAPAVIDDTDDMFVSSMENSDESEYPFRDKGSASDDASPSPTEDPNATPTPEPTPYITPEEFDVGKCCIYINGESDSAFGTEIITAINKARTDLGYKPLISNKSLSTCADRRTRELAASYSHTRPNGLPFYSLAPEHFKAEMLCINNQKAEEVVDIMIKRDPISRNLIFTEKYQSIGASCFKCNGIKYAVVAFGL